MTSDEIVSSWKNEDYRLSLSVDEQALLPENPAGLIELSDWELLGIEGGSDTIIIGGSIAASIIISITITVPITYILTKMPNC
jgi:mersacidin/lichenicidin family type 2 lantibiotic